MFFPSDIWGGIPSVILIGSHFQLHTLLVDLEHSTVLMKRLIGKYILLKCLLRHPDKCWCQLSHRTTKTNTRELAPQQLVQWTDQTATRWFRNVPAREYRPYGRVQWQNVGEGIIRVKTNRNDTGNHKTCDHKEKGSSLELWRLKFVTMQKCSCVLRILTLLEFCTIEH